MKKKSFEKKFYRNYHLCICELVCGIMQTKTLKITKLPHFSNVQWGCKSVGSHASVWGKTTLITGSVGGAG